MYPKKSGLTTKFWREIPTVFFAVKKTPDGNVGLQELSKTKQPSGFARESNVTAPASACAAAFSRGRTCWVLQGKMPLARKPRDKNSRLNKTDKADNCFFTQNIQQVSIDWRNIKWQAALRKTLHQNVTFRKFYSRNSKLRVIRSGLKFQF